ncbi:hypothetical protein ACQEVZ_27940 [Dactylosporangium sp. CA-152071]|uniref:hypothetical protein n=1 Tax=Dactylosporangium sp. CA-152071 TaxID=3239933 RepID=UPI003D93A815
MRTRFAATVQFATADGHAGTREDVMDRSVECRAGHPADERRRVMKAANPELRHALDRAYTALLAGDTVSASALLQPHLTAVPESALPDAVRGEAATLWASLLVNGAGAADRSASTALAVRWARYGAATARQLHGNSDWATLRAQRVLAEALTAGGARTAARAGANHTVAVEVSQTERARRLLSAARIFAKDAGALGVAGLLYARRHTAGAAAGIGAGHHIALVDPSGRADDPRPEATAAGEDRPS